MSTGFRINNQELYEIYENFPADIAELYNVTPSAFSNEENRFLKCEMSLIDSHGIIFPTSANENCGGYNESNYRVNSVPIDVGFGKTYFYGILQRSLSKSFGGQLEWAERSV